MSEKNTDRNLLIGIIALQMDFVTNDQLIAAMHLWIANKERTIAQILCENGSLTEGRKLALEAIVEEAIQKQGGDLSTSLAVLQETDQYRTVFSVIGDAKTEAHHEQSGEATVRFQRLRPHAKGGMGAVWVALDHELNREVAVKEIQSRYADLNDARIQFLLEGEITGGLEHPGIVPIYGMGSYPDGRPYYAMRFIRGDSLKDAIDQYHAQRPHKLLGADRNAIELRKLLSRFNDVCHAISYAHSRGVLHRDLKPGNIMLGKFGETLVVDWGLAQTGAATKDVDNPLNEQPLRPQSGSNHQADGSTPGTIQFMSPEQAEGKLSSLNATSDIYSLGATLYNLLTGKPSIADRDLFVALRKVQKGDFPKPTHWKSDIPKPLEAICLKAMSLLPQDRYTSAIALAEDIECWMADEPVSAWQDTRLQRAQRWLRKHRAWAQAGALSLLIIAIVSSCAIYLINRSRLAEKTAREISEYSALFDISLHDELEISRRGDDAYQRPALERINLTLQRLRALNGPGVEAKFEALVDQVDNHLAGMTSKPRFDESTQVQFDRCLGDFEQIFGRESKVAIERWKEVRTSRLSEWNEIINLRRFQNSDLSRLDAAGSEIEVDLEGRLTRSGVSNNTDEVLLINLPACNLDWQVEFDSSWTARPMFGLTLNYGDRRKKTDESMARDNYELLISVPEFYYRDRSASDLAKLPTIEQFLRGSSNGELRMWVLRNGQLLRSRTVHLDSGPLRLSAIREDQVIKFSAVPIGSLKGGVTLECRDPFAIPNQPGALGVVLPTKVRLVAMSLRQKTVPTTPSPMEKGDMLYLAGRFDEAKIAYGSVLASSESKYKLALCYENTGDSSSYNKLVQELASSLQGERVDQWSMLAALRLLASQAKGREWEGVRSTVTPFRDHREDTSLFAMLPQEDRDLVLQELGKVGLRFRLAYQRDEDRDLIEVRKDLMDVLLEDDSVRFDTLWRDADIYRMNGQSEKAESILQDLVENRWRSSDGRLESFNLPLSSKNRRVLLSDLSWVLSAELRRPEAALAVIDRWLIDGNSFNENYLPLMIERARVRLVLREVALENKDPLKAKELLELAKLDLANLDLVRTSSPDLTYMEWGEGQLLRVLIALEEQVDKEQGEIKKLEKLQWEAVGMSQRRSWPKGPLSLNNPSQLAGANGVVSTNELAVEGIAISFSKEIAKDEVDRMIRNYFPGSGISSSVAKNILSLVLSPDSHYGSLTRDDFFRRLIGHLYDSPQGNELRKKLILRNCSLLEFQSEPVYHIFYTAIKLAGFDENGYPDSLEPLIWEELRDLVELYNQRVLVESDMSEILKIFSGKYSPKIWSNVSKKFGPKLSAAACYIFGAIYQQRNEPETSRMFFQEVINNPESRAEFKEAAQTELNKSRTP